MILSVTLRSQSGEQAAPTVEDTMHILSRLLPSLEDESYKLLRFVDREGLTIFSQHQMECFQEEWQRMIQEATSQRERSWLEQVEQLIYCCQQKSHSQLWFEEI